MGKHPKLNEIEKRLTSGENFELTDAQYEGMTGVPLPKDKNYLKKRSALANAATKEGYRLEVIEKTVRFIKE